MCWTDWLEDEELNTILGELLHRGSWHFMSCTEQMAAVFREELAKQGYKIALTEGEDLNKED